MTSFPSHSAILSATDTGLVRETNEDYLGIAQTPNEIVCVLLIRENCVWIAHIGDSRIYLFEARKKRLHRLTSDHSLVQALINQGIITEKERIAHPKKNQVLKALGIKENIGADISEKPIVPSKNDIFLLCTDGLCNEVPDKTIKKILAKNATLQEKSDLLMQAAKMAGGQDNITFELVKIGE